jgi:hypothetical protein
MPQFFILLSFLLILSFSGCGEGQSRPYIVGQKPVSSYGARVSGNSNNEVKIAVIEAENKKELAQLNKEIAELNAKRDLAISKNLQDTKRYEVGTHKEIELKKQDAVGKKDEYQYTLYKNALILGGLFLLMVLATVIYFLLRRREDMLRMHRETIEKELLLKDKELQIQMAEKILDTIAGGTLEKPEERRLLETLEKTAPGLPHRH